MDAAGERIDELWHKGMEDRHLPLEIASSAPVLRLPNAPPAALAAFDQSLATAISHAVSEHLQVHVHVVADGIDRLPYNDFLLTLSPATCIGVLRIDPPGVQACIDIPRPLVELALDRPPGEPPHGSGVQLTPSAIGILTSLAAGLSEAWSAAVGREVAIGFETLETNPAALHIMPGEERVTVLCFATTHLGTDGPEATGLIRLCLPEPIVQHLAQTRSHSSPPRDHGESGVELRVLLAETKLRLSDLLSMQVGDIITTDQPADAAASVELDDSIAAPCRPGQLKGMRAVRVTHSLSDLMTGRSGIKQGSGEPA